MTRRIVALLALIVSGWLLLSEPLAQAAPDGEASPSPSAGSSSPGGSDSMDPGSDGSSGTTITAGSKAVPRLMLTAFSTEPATITAGSSFEMSFTLENKSRTERVTNVKVTASVESEGILPAGGSSSTYIARINAGGSVSRTLSFRTLPSLEGKPYGVTLNIEYEDSEHNMLSATETSSVVVAQTNRASTSTPQLTPAELMVGQEGALTFTINNLGKNKLFNTRVSIAEGQGLTPTEVFVGSIDPGASGEVELTVTPEQERTGPVELTITYEDDNGTAATMPATFDLTVAAPQVVDPNMPMEEEPIAEDSGLPWWLIVGPAIGVLALIVLIVVLVRRRKRANALQEDMSFLEGDTLVPTDPN